MPMFLDRHEGGLPPEMVAAVKQKAAAGQAQKAAAGQADEFGAKALNVYWSDSETFCLSDAPNAEAVHKAHEAIGVTLGGGDVQQVESAT